jgi:DNA-binding response OmpR family regulator
LQLGRETPRFGAEAGEGQAFSELGDMMFVIVDDREIVKTGYASSFSREGVASTGLRPDEFEEWVAGVGKRDLQAVEAILIGEGARREIFPKMIRERCHVPVIALNDSQSLEQTLDLFAAGVDDVVRKPVHVREIMARVGAIRRRKTAQADYKDVGEMRVYLDGRDPEVKGAALPLPRRERRILEYLVMNQGKRVAKSQIFNAIYGLFDDEVEEDVVESHISKLRKKLRHRLGYDPIDSKRYLGYCLTVN